MLLLPAGGGLAVELEIVRLKLLTLNCYSSSKIAGSSAGGGHEEVVDIVFLLLITFILKSCLLITIVTISSLEPTEVSTPIVTNLVLRPLLLVLIVTCLQILKANILLLVTGVTSSSHVGRNPATPPASSSVGGVISLPAVILLVLVLRLFVFGTLVFHYFYE